jgi:8-oxo-dGTP pyrophosphatase MutT (NUDIX family)
MLPTKPEPGDQPGDRERPVRPRDAASLVLVDKTADEPVVLMGRRPRSSAFTPDAFVFPGGKVDRTDSEIRSPFALGAETERLLASCAGGSVRRARALAHAAIRETFEETGLMLARPGAMRASESGTWRHFVRLGMAPDPGGLRFFARAITPTASPMRFHARFFMADAASVAGEIRETGELLDLAWFPIREALELQIIDVTEIVLKQVAKRLGPPGDGLSRQPTTVAFVSYRCLVPMVRHR